jgi:hypothetical protein
MTPSRLTAAAVLLVSALAGWYAAVQVGGMLAISFEEKQLPPEGYSDWPFSLSPPIAEAETAMRYRFVDLGGVGILPDTAAWRVGDYSHHNRAFQHIFRADSPYVEPVAMAHAQEQFRAYASRVAEYGYNGIIVPGFLQFVDFDRVGGGFDVYPADSEYRRRHRALREAYGEMFRTARELGLVVVLNTDMLALTEPLERYLGRRFGRIDAADPALWEVYRAGMDELFERFPEVYGVMIRVGEAGTVYNLPGWNYRSELHVRTDAAVRAMLGAFDASACAHGRRIFFRTWTVGVGEVGDLHTNPATYERVLGGLSLPNTVFSTKFVMGDFYSYLPVNPTLLVGTQPRIVELQARREFEGFAAFPNFLGPLHAGMLRSIREQNPHLEGVWLWTQEGGPLRQSPMSLYPFHGFWHLLDADVYVAGHLARDPDANVAALTRGWVRRTFGDDPAVVGPLTEVLLRSREPVLRGLYIGEFARYDVRALGLEPPPMLWVFEWDIVTGSSAVLSAIYHTSRSRLGVAVVEGFDAVEEVRRLRALAARVDRDAVAQPEVFDRLLESLAYQENLFSTLAWYRQAFLNHYRWLDTGEAAAYRSWRTAAEQFRAARDGHVAAYRNNLDFPAFAFFDADTGMAHAERGPLMMWLARGLLVLAAAVLLVGHRRRPVRGVGHADGDFAGTAWIAALGPLLLVLAAHLVFSAFLSPAYILVVGLVLACTLGVLLVPNRRRSPRALLVRVSRALLLGTTVLLAVVAVRGPLYLWYGFWIRDGFRAMLFALGAMAGGWILLVSYRALRRDASRPAAQALGLTGMAVGAPVLALGALLQAVGLERAITTLNDELAILPMGLSRILGITTHLNIPLDLPLHVIGFGAALSGIGLLLIAARPAGRHPSPPGGDRGEGGAAIAAAFAEQKLPLTPLPRRDPRS